MSNIKSASMIQNIIRLSKQGVGQRGIARKFGISRNTVARYLAQEPGASGSTSSQKADAVHGQLDRRSLCLEHLQFILDELSLGCPADESSRISVTGRVSRGVIPA